MQCTDEHYSTQASLEDSIQMIFEKVLFTVMMLSEEGASV